MTKLVQTIQRLQQELERWRGKSLKETPTRTVFIEPLLEALGWDVRDLDEVEPEYSTVDGKPVDYALKINRKPVVYLEAKPLDDDLEDVKSVTQIVNYANADGIDWCILTNGRQYRVYRSSEKVPAPEKLLFECSIDPSDNPSSSLEDIVRPFERLSKEALAEGQLDAWGKQVFVDGKVRKTLERLFADPPRAFINLIKRESSDAALRPDDIRQSLKRIWQVVQGGQTSTIVAAEKTPGVFKPHAQKKRFYTFEQHLEGKPQAIQELFHRLDAAILALAPGRIQKKPLAKVIDYLEQNRIFCSVHVQKGGLRIWVKLNYNALENPPQFVRDVSKIGHWGVGDTEIALTDEGQLPRVIELIKLSYEKVQR